MFTMISILIVLLFTIVSTSNDVFRKMFKPFLFTSLLAFSYLNFKNDLFFVVIYIVVYVQLIFRQRLTSLADYMAMAMLTLVPVLLEPTQDYYQYIFLLFAAKVLELFASTYVVPPMDSKNKPAISFGFLFLLFFLSTFSGEGVGQIFTLLIYFIMIYEFIFYPAATLQLLKADKSHLSYGLYLFCIGFLKPYSFFGILSSYDTNATSLGAALIVISFLTLILFIKEILFDRNYPQHQAVTLMFGLNTLFILVFLGNSLESLHYIAYFALGLNLLIYKYLLKRLTDGGYIKLSLLIFYPTPLSPLFYLFLYSVSLYYNYGSLVNLFLMLLSLFIPMSFYFITKRVENDSV
ncbi:MAG: hypothetical protein CME62_17290 [Halobacteriovoraceae bacterium]|nr:hypothetical protein [Halobacteriovoraceae bacterium]|tara:strand:- start:4563 stop:5612 length:1050 start_codon:yes stop_codon:yes gene_type:complete